MASTPQQAQTGAASFYSIQDKLAAIIYLLNTKNMSASDIQSNSACFQCISDKLGAIIYLLANQSGGVQHGTGSPVGAITPTPGLLYINDSDSTLWAVANGAWIQLV